MTPDTVINDAIALIASVPGYLSVAADLERRQPRFAPGLPDRGQASLRGTICVGPEALWDSGDARLVSLAGTLVHEHWHTKQNPLLKTVSFWGGVLTRSHPMRRFEWPAYAHQVAFLRALATHQPPLAAHAGREHRAVLASYRSSYGEVPAPVP